jgi:hypothetical protein
LIFSTPRKGKKGRKKGGREEGRKAVKEKINSI